MNMTETIEAVTYGRNSSDQQLTSQDIQEDIFTLFSTDGFVKLFGKSANYVENYKDHGKSASKRKSKRSDFNRLLEDVELGKVKIVVVVNLSRFSRLHPLDALSLHKTLWENNVRLVSIQDDKAWDYDNSGELIQLLCKSNEDYEYARTVGQNTLEGRLRATRLGQTTSSESIYGMQKLVITEDGQRRIVPRGQKTNKGKHDKSYTIPGDDQEQKIVRWLFSEYAKKDVSLGYLARSLNDHENAKVRLGPTGKGWDLYTIADMLSNPKCIGLERIGNDPTGEHFRTNGKTSVERKKHQHNPLVCKAKFNEGIVDQDIWDQVQAKLERNKRNNYRCHKRKDGEGYPLSTILACGKCGRAMQAKERTEGRTRYSCQSDRRIGSGCGYWSIGEDEILPFILAKLDRELIRQLEDKPQEIPVDQDGIEAELDRLRRKIAAIKTKMATASLDATIQLSDTLTTLVDQEASLRKQVVRIDPRKRQLDLAERWEAIVEPMLIPIPTGDIGKDDATVDQLGIRSEVDRLFNTTMVRPSVLRTTLQELEVSVRLHFKERPKTTRSKGKRTHWEVDWGRIEADFGRLETQTGLTGAC